MNADQRHVAATAAGPARLAAPPCRRPCPASTVRGVVIGRQVRIGGRIPLAVVDAVDDARQHVAALLQHPFQAAAQRRGLNLFGIARADRVRCASAKTSPVFSRFRLPKNSIWCQLKYFQSSPVSSMSQCQNWPWIGHVVDREQRGDLLVAGHAAIFDLQIGGNQAGLPVVGVQHVDLQIQQANRFQHRAAEEDEPLAVVDVVLAVVAW